MTSGSQIPENSILTNDDECNNENKLHEQELCDEVISSDEASDKADTANNKNNDTNNEYENSSAQICG